MKKSKLIALAIAASGLFSACSSGPNISEQTPSTLIPIKESGILFIAPGIALPEGEGNHDMPTRASYYDGTRQGVYFDWVVGDKVGIFPVTTPSQQAVFTVKTVNNTAEQDDNGVSRAVFNSDNGDFHWVTENTYRAYYPYTSAATDITAVPMDYRGQVQEGKPDLTDHFNGSKENYNATEKTSSAHLTAKSFLLSNGAQPTADDKMHFKMSHLGGVVRFYLVMPIDIDADITEVRLVATKPVFHEQATLNVNNGTTPPAGSASNNLTLKLNNVHAKYVAEAYDHYVIAYMMAYPVALTTALTSVDGLYIYVRGKDTSSNDVYFRSVSLTKKDITAGKLTQFSVYQREYDEPVDMQPITVQEWQDGLTLSNGEDGKGTENW